MGAHYPAVALIGVTALVDREATVEIAADAVLPPPPPAPRRPGEPPR
jgi:hypothetical protein